MAPRTYEENLVGTFIASGGVADPTAVTTTEIGLGTDYSSYIRKNGVSWPSGRGTVDTATVDVKQNTTYPGSEGGVLEMTFLKENRDGNTAAHTEFVAGEIEGYWVFGFQGSNDQVGDVVDLYHVVGDRPVPNDPGPDENQMFTVQFHLQDKVHDNQTIAA